ncbi:MAG: nicotinate-nucleotide--dimethylbenzimidazole phosphoribosyltransferase [Pseudomonadota bacterium]
MTMQNNGFEAALRAAIDGKTKPPGSLGRIEELAAQIARVQCSLTPRMESCRHFVFAADHGIAVEGVSAYPQAVTRQMVANFAAGGAASNVFARANGIDLTVVDAGVAGGPMELDGVVEARMGEGTASALNGPAMTPAIAQTALDRGKAFGRDAGTDAVSVGEMGIGNTSAAALLAAKLTCQPVAQFTGRGTGLDDKGLAAKTAILERAADRTADRLDGISALSEVGGFEIAMMAGAMLGAADAGRVVIVDGFIAAAAAAAALDLEPDSRAAMVFAHLSAEAGHRALCDALGAEPLLHLDMRLGEGTGALLAWPLLRSAAAMLSDMASFSSAGVSEAE